VVRVALFALLFFINVLILCPFIFSFLQHPFVFSPLLIYLDQEQTRLLPQPLCRFLSQEFFVNLQYNYILHNLFQSIV